MSMTGQIAVLGAGTRGVGIAYVGAQAGYEVFLVEPDDARMAGALRTVSEAVQSAIARAKLDEAKHA